MGTAAALAAVTLFAAACTGSSSSSPHPSPTATKAAVPALKAAWTANPGDLWNPSLADTTPQFWTTSTSVIVPQTRSLTSYSATTGTQRWRLALPAAVCTIADAPNDDGIAAVLMGHGPGVNTESCGSVGAIDTRTGRLLWTKSIEHVSSYGFDEVAVGPRAVALTNTCDSALTLSVADGATLVHRASHGSGCFDSFTSDGRILLDGRDHVKHAALIGYDAVSGKKLWSVPLHGDAADPDANPDLDRVISSDPVVIDARTNSHRFLQRIEPARKRVVAFGRESSDSYPAPFVRHLGSHLLVQYGQSQELFDYDAASGREVHRTVLEAAEAAIGLRGDDVISVVTGGSALGSGSLAAVSTDPASGSRQVLATTTLSGVASYLGSGLGFHAVVVGSTLVIGGDGGLAGFTLPARGTPIASLAGAGTYAAHDIRPDTVVDLCRGMSVATKRELGFVEPARPAPANCQFVEPEADDDIVDVRISVLTSAPKGTRSAVDVAKKVVADLAKRDTTNHLPAATPVGGIGDEAFEAANADADHFHLVRVITRRANVTVYADLTEDGVHNSAAGLRRLRRGGLLVAKDMIATIDRRR